LHQLEAGKGVVELDARFGIVQCYLVAGSCRPSRPPGNIIARLVQAGKRATEPLDMGQQLVGRDATLLKVQLGGD